MLAVVGEEKEDGYRKEEFDEGIILKLNVDVYDIIRFEYEGRNPYMVSVVELGTCHRVQ